MPCGGSGQVISNLGGTPSTVSCPWCEGSGIRSAGIDAQAHWPTEEARASLEHGADESDAPAAGDASASSDQAA